MFDRTVDSTLAHSPVNDVAQGYNGGSILNTEALIDAEPQPEKRETSAEKVKTGDRVLVAFDPDSTCFDRVVETACRLAPPETAELKVIVVERDFVPWAPVAHSAIKVPFLADVLDDSEKLEARRRALAALISSMADKAHIHFDVCSGDFAEVVSEEAERWKANLIVMETGHRSWIDRVLPTSANTVMAKVNCPLVAVPTETQLAA